MLKIKEMCDYARYSENLEKVINKLGGIEVLRHEYEASYQGDVDIDVLLEDGRVFSYHYYYGSCSGCDEWEHRNLDDEEIEEVMLQECTLFNSLEEYKKWQLN